MHRKAALISFMLVILMAGATLSAVQSIPMQPLESQFAVLSQGPDELRFRVEVGEITALDVMTRSGPFTRLLIPGFHSSQTAGAPELPMMNRLIAIPCGARVNIQVEAVRGRTIDLADFGIRNPLFPAQPSMPKDVDPESWPFVYNQAAYQVDKVDQELVRVVNLGQLRAMTLGRLEVSPVEYLPRTGQIRVTESLDFRVVFEGADQARQAELLARTASPFFGPVYAKVANARSFQDNYPDRVGDVVTMVIVTNPMFENQLQDFVAWKTQRGFRTIVAVTGTPEVGTTTTSIRNYIQGLYNNATPELPAPSFVLFVGDVAQMPTFTQSGDPTDRPYCAVDADLVPDIYYGRFSATNSTQLQAILDKTMMYDQFTMPDPSYLGEAVMIAGVDSYYSTVWANGQIIYGTDNYFNLDHGILSHTYLYPQSGSQSANIIQDVSNGCAYVNYTAHGSETGWANPGFNQTNVNNLQNDGKYCLAVGNCCLTSAYDYGECFAETWLRAAHKGAIGYIGGSNSTYWDEDYWWGVGYTSNIVARPRFEDTGCGAYDGMFHDHGEAEHLWYVTNDAIVFCGNLSVMESGSYLTTYYWNIYNLMGDPSLSVYLGMPDSNPVSTSDAGPNSITVQAVPGSYVGLTQDGVLIGAGTIGETGSEVCEFFTPVATGSLVHLVVMMQNREPYVADIQVGQDLSGVAETPPALHLEGNQPNPFNPTTALLLVMPRPGEAVVDVLDVRGSLVRTLWRGELPAGPQRLTWDGLDGTGQAVASGVYLARVQAGGQTVTHKMLLAR